ncbi:hypothetical protein Salat_2600400, partial [Sesamum alatum]
QWGKSATTYFNSVLQDEPVLQDEQVLQDEPVLQTQSGPTPSQPFVQGPSMYEQLQMGHTSMPIHNQVTLQPRLSIRAPPPMTRTGFMPCFSSRPSIPIPKTVIKDHGRKWVDISKWPSQSGEHNYKF